VTEPDPGPDGDWTRPGVYEVAAGVYRMPLPLPNDGLRAVNVYVLTEEEGLVLVDAGWAITEAREAMSEGLATLDAGIGDIRRFLVTHAHRDHYTLAVTLRREFGTSVALGAGEKPSLQALNDPRHPPLGQQVQLLRELGASELADQIAGAAHHDRDLTIWQYPDEWLEEGALQLPGRTLQVVPTPGHTAGHVVLHDDGNQLLFAGDHVLPTITPSIGLEPVVVSDPLGSFLRSLERVRRMPDARLLPAHGPVTASVHARIDELVAHHGRRLDQSEDALRNGATTAYEAARQLRWTRREHTLDSLDPFNAMLAVAETGAHLDLLVAQGRLTKSVVDGVRRYTIGG
jgi:glyoxylase-like metal-dependent hydrolase (beta-lactamase superfamily II)